MRSGCVGQRLSDKWRILFWVRHPPSVEHNDETRMCLKITSLRARRVVLLGRELRVLRWLILFMGCGV